MRPYLNKVWVAEFDGLCSAEFLVFPCPEGLNSRFLALRLNSQDFVSFANQSVNGDRPRADFDKLASFQILLPPTAEQERIVAKLDTMLSRIAAGESAARQALNKLDHYRASVLHAAVTGKLTREWRKTHKPGESGKQLLKRLLIERRNRWEATKLKRLCDIGSTPKNDKWKHKYIEPEFPSKGSLPTIPRTWCWGRLDMIAELGSGISVSRNRVVTKAISVPYLRVANVLRGKLDLSEIKAIRVNRDRLASYLLQAGDILFNEGGDLDKLGRGWIWENQIRNCIHQNHVFRARLLDQSLTNPKLVSHWGNTFGQQFFMRHGTQTTNLASINRSALARLPVPVIPVLEQEIILRSLDLKIAATARQESAINRQLERARAMRQSLLAEAFTGVMVQQQRTDEHASVLLKRICVAKEMNARKSKATRMSKPKSKRIETLEQLESLIQCLGKGATPERLLLAAELGDDVDRFFDLLRAGRDKGSLLVPTGKGSIIRRA